MAWGFSHIVFVNMDLLIVLVYVCWQEQFEFCYEMVMTYLKEFDTYSNFR